MNVLQSLLKFNPATVSKVVDPDTGEPLVVYHGTDAQFDEFKKPETNRMAMRSDVGFWFTTETGDTKKYGSNVMEVYLRAVKPRETSTRKLDMMAVSEPMPAVLKKLKAGKTDGLHLAEVKEDRLMGDPPVPEQWVVFDPTQIKSATGNNGNFDPQDDRINFSRSKLTSLKESALDQVHKTLSYPGRVSLWDKTVGTMRHLAERSAVFKPVFEAAQRFIDDVSTLANEVADAAPRLLPRIETLADIIKKKPISAEDNKAIARPRARPRRASFACAWLRCAWKGPKVCAASLRPALGRASGCIGAFLRDAPVRRATKSFQRRAGGR